MERCEVQSGDIAILPQGEFVELSSFIEVIDMTDQNVVWNQHDDLSGDYEFPKKDPDYMKEKKLNDTKMAIDADSPSAFFEAHKDFGLFNTGFIILLTMLIYPVLMVGTNLWNIATGVPLFRELSKLFITVLRA